MPFIDYLTCDQALVIRAFGFKTFEIIAETKISKQPVTNLYNKAIARGYERGSPIKTMHVEDVKQCGPPKSKITL